MISSRELVWSEEFESEASLPNSEKSVFTQQYNTMKVAKETYDENGNKVPCNQNITITTTDTAGQENCTIVEDIIDGKAKNVLKISTVTKNGQTTLAKSITTFGKLMFRYGYLEMRAKVPNVRGAWPSFWMRSGNPYTGEKPFGEIDVFEIYGTSYKPTVENNCVGSSTLHKWLESGHCNLGAANASYMFGETNRFEFDPNIYHTFGVEWTHDFVSFYFDGEMTCKIDMNIDFCAHKNDDGTRVHPGMDCFNQYFYICINNWLFDKIDQSTWAKTQWIDIIDGGVNADYYIDYIRLYQNPSLNEEVIFD